MSSGIHKGQWTRDEDARLESLVNEHGPREWKKFADLMGGTRSAKQCRERWHQNLDPQLNHEPISGEEGRRICQLVAEHGQKWARIARDLQNHRSDNHVKNWWNGSHNRAQRFQASRHPVSKTTIARAGPIPCRLDERTRHPAVTPSRDALPVAQPGMALPHTYEHYPLATSSSSLASRATAPAPLNLSATPMAAYPVEPSQYQFDMSRGTHPYYVAGPGPGRFISPPYSDVPSMASSSVSSVASYAPSTPHSATFPPYHKHYLPDHKRAPYTAVPAAAPTAAYALPPMRKSEELATAHNLLNMAAGPRTTATIVAYTKAGFMYESPPITPTYPAGLTMGFTSTSSSPKDTRMEMRALLN